MKQQTVTVIEGWSESQWHSKKLLEGLAKQGLKTMNSGKVDVVITHSSGCYLIPENLKSNLTVLINPPYWPGKSIIVSIIQKNLSRL